VATGGAQLAAGATGIICAAGEIGLAVGAFIAVHPVAALATTVLAACECLPLAVDEFAGMECFSGSGE
jgi:predicted ABC-type sugar transport system permease subunit